MVPVRIGVIGTGYGGRVALPVYCESTLFAPVAVWSRRLDVARRCATEHGVALATAEIDELLSCPGLEAVHVATPVVMHAEIAIAAAERGLHVLCEKPIAANLSDARRVADAIDAAGVVGAVNFTRRVEPARRHVIAKAREVLGTPRMIRCSVVRSDHADARSRPFTWVHDAALGGGRLQAYGVHDLDFALSLGVDVVSVVALKDVGVAVRIDAANEPHAVTVEDAYAILMNLAGGGIAIIESVATARHERGDVIEVWGDGGTVHLAEDGRVSWGRTGERLTYEGPFPSTPHTHAAFAQIAGSFAASIRSGAAPNPSFVDGLRAQSLLDAVHLAAAERRWVAPERVTAT